MKILECDIVIVGSGAGGGTVAERLSPLCENGARILLLEAGPHYTCEFFTQREVEMSQSLYLQAAGYLTMDSAITLATARMVGGSSGVYTGVTFRIPDQALRNWNVPGLTPEELAPRFERLERENNVANLPDDQVNKNNRLFKKGVESLGWECKELRLNLRNCEGHGFCNLGCAEGAKQGTLEVQIPMAVERGVELIPNAKVTQVHDDRSMDVQINPAPPGSRPGSREPGEYEVRAKKVILAAGCPGTPALLLGSEDFKKLPSLGRYVTLHPTATTYGIHPEVVDGHRGFPKTYYSDQFSEREGYYIETCFYYPMTTAKNIYCWGEAHRRIMLKYNHLMSCILLIHDRSERRNRVVLKNGQAAFDYKLSEGFKESMARAQRAVSRIFFAAGCEQVHVNMSSKTLLTPEDLNSLNSLIRGQNYRRGRTSMSTAHLMGGCRMGADPENSVTDSRGQVHGTDWLYVADSTLFPSCSRANPYLTIMALADRVAEGIMNEMIRI
jgi:choline dehydrogenase-like flavoprotein